MKKIRYFFEYLLVKFWFQLVQYWGLKRATSFSSNLFKIIGMRLKATKVAEKNLQRVFPELKSKEIKQIILDVWENLGYMAAETPILMKLPQDEFNQHIKITGLENLNKVKARKALFYTAHLANWEILGKAVLPYGFSFNAVYRAANNKLVDELMNNLRHTIEVNLIPKGKSGAKLIIQALQKNQHVIMLMDQKMNDGIKVPFLGLDAMTAPAIANLALKYDCPIIPVQVIRQDNSCFEVIIHPQMEYNNPSIEGIIEQINQQIGEWVKARPSQWFWLHRRWIDQ